MLSFLSYVNLKHFVTDKLEWKWEKNDLHVPVQFFQQRRVSLQSCEGFTQTGGQSQDPWTGCPLWLHVLPQFLTVIHMKNVNSLEESHQFSASPHYKTCGCSSNCISLPVLHEYVDCRWMVGTVGHIHGLHLWHQTQKKPSNPLLVIRKSARM